MDDHASSPCWILSVQKSKYKTVDFAAAEKGHQPHTLFFESTIYVDCFTSVLSTFTICFLAINPQKFFNVRYCDSRLFWFLLV